MAKLNQAYQSLVKDLDHIEVLRGSAQAALRKAEVQVCTLEAEVEVLERVADLFRLLIDREVIDNARTVESFLPRACRQSLMTSTCRCALRSRFSGVKSPWI